MNEFQQAELISSKIKEFIEKQPNDFLDLITQLDRLGKIIMGKYHDIDEHNGLELFNIASKKIENGKRKWAYENVNLEAMIYNSARSHLSSELKKIINGKTPSIFLNKLDGEGNKNETDYNSDGIASIDDGNNGNNGLYLMQEIDDNIISEMIKKELPLIDGDIDLVSIEIMDAIKKYCITKRKEIAEVLKLEYKDVKNAFERIRGAANKVFSKLPKIDKEEIRNYKIDYRIKDIIK